ncbi:sigma 54-interacting transcriptional regulator [Salicibibacter cibi]|uniref:Sigma 54-interacting transcriptional regulator n=1 Tax=Salicibibacter cibi TaxID=2743001 RepID=A0A7T7CFP0_9BACI|nr:sigma 54-interacting transcriptional regulator [Salicibibacter cibi]QQK80283.1 sigma 54-interacting transcriptional regulator [Salicibibacter cibi]
MFNNETLQEFLGSEKFEPESIHDFPLAQVLSSIHDGIVVVNEQGVIVYANPSYTRILNVPVDRVIGKKMKDVEHDARILTVLKTGKAILQEPIYLDSLQAEVVVDSTPLYKGNKIIGGVTVFKKMGEVIDYYNALTKLNEIKKKKKLKKNKDELKDPFKNIIGSDPLFKKSLQKASAVALSGASILLSGESGVGKEVFANAIHKSSDRQNNAFVKINCSAIPESLLESELFGYEEGAFTGAKKGGKIGKFEQANGGTVFLDEIGDMPIQVQAKLLRVLQEKEFERVGGLQTINVDIRIIAATNQNLEAMIENKQFREDLYYRLNVVQIRIPALRERPLDIELIAKHFTSQFTNLYNKKLILSSEVVQRLKHYDWPGNVRQLANFIEHGIILCDEPIIQTKHLPEQIFEIDYIHEYDSNDNEELRIIKALKASKYNRTKAMEDLGISRRTFYKKIKKYNIEL